MKKLSLFAAFAAVCLGPIAETSRADLFNYHVDLNVAALLGAPANAPYYLDFQLNGDGLGLPNTITLSNFVFTAGTATPGTAQMFGNASGSLSSSVTLTVNSASAFNEFFQQFLGATDIQFDVSSTQNGSGVTPDGFEVAILDSESGNPQIATNAPDGVSLLIQTINGPPNGPSASLADVSTYQSTNPAGVTTTVSAVPEPATVFSLIAGLGVIVLFRSRQK